MSASPDTAAPAQPFALELREISVRFPGALACDRASLALRAGEVHALVGENGAGKSSLMHVAAGLVRPESGQLLCRGVAVRLRSPRDAQRLGVAMVFQRLLLVERLSVLDNLLLGWERARAFWLRRARLRRELEALAERFGLRVDLDSRVDSLSSGERQRVGLLRALSRDARVLVLDEPSALLTPEETAALSASLRALAAQGLAVLLVSHKLPEVLAVADRVTVMHRGRTAARDLARAELDARTLAALMVGRVGGATGIEPTERTDPTDRSDRSLPSLLELDDVRVVQDGVTRLQGVSLSLPPGRITAVAGVAGNGQRELVAVCAGLLPPRTGRVRLLGEDLTGRGARAFLERGLACLLEDRFGEATDGRLSIRDSAALRAYRRLGRGPLGWLSPRALTAHAAGLTEENAVRLPGLEASTSSLSGGNLQRLLLGRELAESPRVLLAHQPTQGLDLAAAAAVRARLLRAAREGAAVLLVSSDLDEVLELGHRVHVLYRGRLSPVRQGPDLDRREIGALLAGLGAEGDP